MIFWMVRHIPTGRFWPETFGKYSHWDPTGWWGEWQSRYRTPRLFLSHANASKAIGQYMRGSICLVWNGFDLETPDLVTTPKKDRKREDFEIVEVKIAEIQE